MANAQNTIKQGWIEMAGRVGYGVKGVVYAIVGLLAIQVAVGVGGETAGAQQAIREIGQQPFGQLLLLLTALGLVGYSAWRFFQAVADPQDKGHDAVGLVKRIGYAVSGLTYVALAFTAATFVFGGGGGSGTSKQAWTARLLEQPFGPWLVGLVGAVIIGVGLYHFYRMYKAKFVKHYKTDAMSQAEQRWARRIGRFGLGARGVTFVLIGVFFIQAAWQANANEVKGLGGALQTLGEQPYGAWLLGVVALGFVAYGIYCFSRARYRRFETS